jgi:hypothetical protein
VTGVLAICGITFGLGLQLYVMVYDWPMNFGGKPHAAWPAFIPITFEAMVFWAAIGSAIVAIVAGKKDTIPQPPPLAIQTGATIDRFVVWISATDPKWNPADATAFLKSLGAQGVRLVDVDVKGEAHA